MISTNLNRLIFFLLLLISVPVMSEKAEQRSYDRTAMKAYENNPKYSYMKLRMRPPTIWERLQWYLQDLWNEFWNNPIASRLTLYLFILVMAAVAIFFILRMRFRAAMAQSSRSFAPDTYQRTADIQMNYAPLMQEALEAKNFKAAIRYMYLFALAQLSEKNHLKLADWKTPYDYQLELKGQLVEPYSRLCLMYEYAWYGDFDVKRADFDKGRNYLEKIQEGMV